jgi:BirA family transcriptional regulator, biotin operon repressor / biotin---[acetyl-CoA-carboxylase] ligase
MLGPRAAHAGHLLIANGEVVSTMDEARQLAGVAHAPVWVTATAQTAGRGRHGRNWVSPPGNLYATLFLPAPCAAARGPELSFVAGLALHDAATTLCRGVDFKLKWPNDLLLGTAKCAGLLLEGITRGDQFDVLIGFGVNIAHAPQDTPYPATTLRKVLGATHGADAVLAALSDAMEARLAQWCGPGGFASIRKDWLIRAAFMGDLITLRLPSGPLSGRFVSLDDAGRLILSTSAGQHVIDAGDLFFGGNDAPHSSTGEMQ